MKRRKRISDRTWSAHVVSILRRHPRAESMEIIEVSYLAEPVRQELERAYQHIDETARGWLATGNDVENRVLWAELWKEAAALWLETSTKAGRP